MSKLAAPLPRRAQVTADLLVRTFQESHAELVSTLFFVLGNQEDALDAIQEAFVKCWRCRRVLPKIRNLRAWVFRVALNAAKDLHRNAWRRRLRPLSTDPLVDMRADNCPVDTLVRREALDQLRAALTNLRPQEKEVFLLRQNGDFTYEEIAALRRRPVGTIKTQMRTALHKLRRILQESG